MATILSELIVDHGVSFPLLILLHGGSLLLLLLLLLLMLLLLLLLVLLLLLESGLSGSCCSLLRSSLFHNILWRSATSFPTLGQIRLPRGCIFRSRIVKTDLFPVQCFTKELIVIRMNVMCWEIFLAQFVLQDFSHDRTQNVAVRGRNLSPMTGAIDVTHQFIPGISVFRNDAEGLGELAGGHLVDIGSLEVGDTLARGGHHCGIELRKAVGLLHSHLRGRRREDAAVMGCAGMGGRRVVVVVMVLLLLLLL
jgi:hypothetical protein